MPRIDLNEKIIARLRGRPADDPSDQPITYYDKTLPGFGVAISTKTNLGSYIVEREVNGRKVRKAFAKVGGALSFKEAKEEAKDRIYRMDHGWDPREGKRGSASTLASALEAYLAGADITERTRRHYRTRVELHLADWINKPLAALTGEMVEQRYMKLSAPTATAVMTTLGIVYRNAARRDPKLPPDPTQLLRGKWKTPLPRTRHVRADDMAKFYAAIDRLENHIERDFLKLLLFTGMRLTEAATLTWDDVDFTAGVIRIPAQRTKSRRKLDLVMTDLLRKLLRERLARGKFEYVFPSNRSPTGHITGVKHALRAIATATGIKISHHDLRRSYVTACEATDMNWSALQSLVNHSPGKGYSADYVQMTTARLREPAQRVVDLIRRWARI
jgi:integrase